MSRHEATLLVLAASRKGVDDPVARLQNVSHKCLVVLDGQVMLERVIEAAIDSGCFARIFVSIEDAAVVRSVPRLAAWMDEGRLGVVKSADSLAGSIRAAATAIPNPLPLIVTTGDNALHTPAVLRDFMDQFWTRAGDVALGFTTAEVVLREVPDSTLAFHRLKDGGFSSCNLYGLRRERALDTARIFEGGGQFGKKHWRILKAFGVMPFILYKLKSVTGQQLLSRIARNLGVTADLILLPYAFAPIDVDNAASFAQTEAILRQRREQATI